MDKPIITHDFSTKPALPMDKQHFIRNFSMKTALPMDNPSKTRDFSTKVPVLMDGRAKGNDIFIEKSKKIKKNLVVIKNPSIFAVPNEK